MLRPIGWVKQFIHNSRSVKEQQGVRKLNPAESWSAGLLNQVTTKIIFQTVT